MAGVVRRADTNVRSVLGRTFLATNLRWDVTGVASLGGIVGGVS